jgi:hypothetical protein
MSERIARVLGARLEELAQVAERSGADAAAVAALLEAASVATMHAVALNLLSASEARAIWRDACERHPVLDRGSTQPLPDAA